MGKITHVNTHNPYRRRRNDCPTLPGCAPRPSRSQRYLFLEKPL